MATSLNHRLEIDVFTMHIWPEYVSGACPVQHKPFYLEINHNSLLSMLWKEYSGISNKVPTSIHQVFILRHIAKNCEDPVGVRGHGPSEWYRSPILSRRNHQLWQDQMSRVAWLFCFNFENHISTNLQSWCHLGTSFSTSGGRIGSEREESGGRCEPNPYPDP